MSGAAASQNPTTTQNTTSDSSQTPQTTNTQGQQKRLEEDDEFEDFPVEDWNDEETDMPANGAGNGHLWEESWDDDDTSEDFAQMLKEELKKVEANNQKR